MIRLTLNAHSEPEIHLFNKAIILIGSEAGNDLVLSDQNIQPIHLKIIQRDEFPILINCSNDPFTSVNGFPFGKKLLNSGDIITFNQTTILFENLESLQMPTIKTEAYHHKFFTADENQASTPQIESQLSFPLPFERDVKAFEENELHQTSLDDLLKKLELETSLLTANSSQEISERMEPDKKNQASLKDDYLKDLEDDHQTATQGFYEQEKEPSHLYQAWKWILLFIVSLLTITAAAGTIIYYSVSDKTEAHETKAAQGMADITMALVNAQLNEQIPHNQNWTDIEFLKSNLQAMLSHNSSYASQINSQGEFNCCPYSLRIYMSGDLSHFLLIAQPAPSLLNWLIPQSLIVVDSQLMQLRILKDVRSLNRLLANTNPLDGMNGKEITALVQQGTLIRLSSLANESTHLDFAPPKKLAWVRPGCENFIYNAPRYFRLGNQILEKSMALSSSKKTRLETMTLKEKLENISWLNHLVIYSSQGKNSALQARQGIRDALPTSEILFGYLLFNAEGKIQQAQLIKEEEETSESFFGDIPKEEDLITFEDRPAIENVSKIQKEPVINQRIDTRHPLFIQLQALTTARENELGPLATALVALIHKNFHSPNLEFPSQFQKLAKIYLNTYAQQNEIITQNIHLLTQQYTHLPNDSFLSFIIALNLENLLEKENESTMQLNGLHNQKSFRNNFFKEITNYLPGLKKYAPLKRNS